MVKEFIRQFYNEGFGSIFYVRPVNYLKKIIKNKQVVNVLEVIIKILYTVLILTFAGYILYKKLF